jgi:hypothetical protein
MGGGVRRPFGTTTIMFVSVTEDPTVLDRY